MLYNPGQHEWSDEELFMLWLHFINCTSAKTFPAKVASFYFQWGRTSGVRWVFDRPSTNSFPLFDFIFSACGGGFRRWTRCAVRWVMEWTAVGHTHTAYMLRDWQTLSEAAQGVGCYWAMLSWQRSAVCAKSVDGNIHCIAESTLIWMHSRAEKNCFGWLLKCSDETIGLAASSLLPSFNFTKKRQNGRQVNLICELNNGCHILSVSSSGGNSRQSLNGLHIHWSSSCKSNNCGINVDMSCVCS